MVAIFFISFWLVLMIVFSFSVVSAFKQGVKQLKRLHQIPCYKCDFFTNDFRLKCTVNPIKACSEEALGCPDFEPQRLGKKAHCQKCSQISHIYISETELQNINIEVKSKLNA